MRIEFYPNVYQLETYIDIDIEYGREKNTAVDAGIGVLKYSLKLR